jgi:hypothetical protein
MMLKPALEELLQCNFSDEQVADERRARILVHSNFLKQYNVIYSILSY